MANSTKSSGKTTSIRSAGSPNRSSGQAGKAATMADLMAKMGSTLAILQKGQAIEGTIKKLEPQEILMDIGAKGDALVIEYDKQNLENLLNFLKVGDRVTATVISPESEEGFPVVSLRRALDEIVYGRFETLITKPDAFEVTIGDNTRGGYFAVTEEGVKGFLPHSQVVVENDLTGKTVKVKILEFDREKKRVVFSQKALDFVMDPSAIAKIIKRDDKVEGEVAMVTPYGLFVTIKKGKDQIEGFIHISEIAYARVENLGDKYKKGDKIEAIVLEIDTTNKRVNLSIKKTLKDTFEEASAKYTKELKVKGKVRDVKSRGVNLELEEGIMGLIPTDKIPSNTTYNPGDSVEAEVVDVDKRKRVVVLSPILKAVPMTYR